MNNQICRRICSKLTKNIEISLKNPASKLLSLIKKGFECGSFCLLAISSILMGLYTFFKISTQYSIFLILWQQKGGKKSEADRNLKIKID